MINQQIKDLINESYDITRCKSGNVESGTLRSLTFYNYDREVVQ